MVEKKERAKLKQNKSCSQLMKEKFSESQNRKKNTSSNSSILEFGSQFIHGSWDPGTKSLITLLIYRLKLYSFIKMMVFLCSRMCAYVIFKDIKFTCN